MNYYPRHIGDYARDTAHLSLIEHGAYAVLLDRYYATERGIPADQAHRLARARTPDEIAAVDTVLGEFFTLVDGVWRNKRADGEIASAHIRIDAARKNGRNGGRPKSSPVPADSEQRENPTDLDKEPTGNPAETQQKPSGLPVGLQNITQQEPKANPKESSPISNLQSPISSLQTNTQDQEQEHTSPSAPPQPPPHDEHPVSVSSKPKPAPANGTRLSPDWFLSTELGEWALAQGLSRERLKQEADKYRDYWLAKPGAAGRKLDWDATFRNWIRRSLETAPGGPANAKHQQPDRPRSPIERFHARRAAEAEQAQREIDASVVGGDAGDLRPPVRVELWGRS